MGMMGFLYIEKRTCRMGQQTQQQVRFFLVRVNHGVMVQCEGRKATMTASDFFDSLRPVALCRNALCSRRLPPKAVVFVSACRRHSFVEGIGTAALMYSKPPQYPENPLWAHEAACPATVFFFLRSAGQDSLSIRFILALVRLPLSAAKSSHR